jgi:hypothetical protein
MGEITRCLLKYWITKREKRGKELAGGLGHSLFMHLRKPKKTKREVINKTTLRQLKRKRAPGRLSPLWLPNLSLKTSPPFTTTSTPATTHRVT